MVAFNEASLSWHMTAADMPVPTAVSSWTSANCSAKCDAVGRTASRCSFDAKLVWYWRKCSDHIKAVRAKVQSSACSSGSSVRSGGMQSFPGSGSGTAHLEISMLARGAMILTKPSNFIM